MNPLQVWVETILAKDPMFLLMAGLVCASLGVFAYLMKVLDLKGASAAAALGLIITFLTDGFYLLVLLVFLIVSFVATKFKLSWKLAHGVAESGTGERGILSVVSNGLIPAMVAALIPWIDGSLPPLLYLSAVAIATADTFASEVGVLSNNVWLITAPRKRVVPGTDGGVSHLGNLAAFLGSGTIAAAGLLLCTPLLWPESHIAPMLPISWSTLLIPWAAGFAGCQVDSLLGATLQKRSLLTNAGVNAASIILVLWAMAVGAWVIDAVRV